MQSQNKTAPSLKSAPPHQKKLNEIHISCFKDAVTTTDPRDIPISEVLLEIRDGDSRTRPLVAQIREAKQHGDKDKVGQLKKQLPGVTWSGTFAERKNSALIQHSGFLPADLDHLGEAKPETREKLKLSPYLFCLFKSPSGDGLKAVFRVSADPAQHLGSFRAVERHVRDLTGMPIDQSGKDVSRLCFMSYDPDLYIRENPIEIAPLPEPERPKFQSNGAANLSDRQRIATELLGSVDWQSESSGFVACPGRHLHTTPDNDRDCKIELLGAPTAHCFHDKCRGILAGVNYELRSRIGKAEHSSEIKSAPDATANQGEKTLQGSAALCPEVESWPEPINGADVLNEISEAIRLRVVLTKEDADTVALWCAHTYCFESFRHSPRLNITAPEKDCGKSTLRNEIALLVNRPLLLDSLTTAVTFRLIDKHKPTLLADETDSWLTDKEELRGVLNAGHAKNGLAARCEGDGNEVRTFKVFAPAVLCGIGSLPSTLHDRSIVIRLKRAKPIEAVRLVHGNADKEKELARKLARFCRDNQAKIAACTPSMPPGVFNRLADNWRPLFAIAEIAGGDWFERCQVAQSRLTILATTDVETQKVALLFDIREILRDKQLEAGHWIESGELIDDLIKRLESQWNEANRGKPITQRWLSVKLCGFGIKPDKLPREENKDQHRGYAVAAFQDSFDRYLAPGVVTSGQVSQEPVLRAKNGETDVETDEKSASVSSSVSAIHEGKTASETDVHLKRGGGKCPDCGHQFLTAEPCFICGIWKSCKPAAPGNTDKLVAEAKRVFNAQPAA
jgi:hypothetical protein